MTKIDFYITQVAERLELLTFACRLTEKALRQRHRVYLHTGDTQTMQQLDELLWTFRSSSFIPHRCQGDEHAPAQCDVLLGCTGDPGDHDDVLINLDSEQPAFFSRFQRVAEVVAGTEPAIEQSRTRYRFYRDRGYPLKVHKL